METIDGLGQVVTKLEQTLEEYRERVSTLTRQASGQLGHQASLLETINFLAHRHDEYKPASLRKFFAALTLAVDEAVARGEFAGHQERAHRDALATRPRPRPSGAEPRTSARKRKQFSKADLHAVCTFLLKRGKPDDKLLVLLLVHGVFLGLRPSEYSDADMQGCMLVIRSRKVTNGRGLGEFRELDLSDILEAEIDSIHRLIADFATAGQGELELLLDRLGSRLRRACKRLGIKSIALYTTRHQAIANMKKAGKTAREIAAAVGHKSLLTANKSYAPRSSGWTSAPTARATQDMIAKIEQTAPPLEPLRAKLR